MTLTLLELAGCLVAGIVLGAIHFASLWWCTRRIASGGSAIAVAAAGLLRFALLGGAMLLAALLGFLPLIMLALGLLAAREVAVRGIRRATP